MVNVADLKKGDNVHYMPDHYKSQGKFENGIVKSIAPNVWCYAQPCVAPAARLRIGDVSGSGFSAFRSPKFNNKKMAIKMYVECIEKPSKDEFTTTDVTVGKTYPVKWIDSDDYQIVDDKGNDRYYRQKFFKDVEWQGVLA